MVKKKPLKPLELCGLFPFQTKTLCNLWSYIIFFRQKCQGKFHPCPAPVLEKRALRAEGCGKREGKVHGIRGGGIRIIILRRWFFHWIAPVPRKLAEGDAFPRFSPWRDLLPGLPLRNKGRSSIERREPAEPDDPNSSPLNPNRSKKPGADKAAIALTGIGGLL
jgi:hypothetical protein